MEKEIWKNIPNAKGYSISNNGDVISKRRVKPVLLKTFIHKGYKSVNIVFDDVGVKRLYIHQLVAMTFLGHVRTGTTKGLVVDHIDNNKLNNNINNIRVVTNRLNSSKDVINKTSKYTGVYYNKESKYYHSTISIKGRAIYLGRSKSEYECYIV